MAAVEIQTGTPLADALQNAVQNKLMELGWTSGGLDDTSLAEYVILMLVNGQTQEEVASSLTNDILGEISTDGAGAPDFANWLFHQVQALSGQASGEEPVAQDGMEGSTEEPTSIPEETNDDSKMDEDVEAPSDGSIPTGPKSMRGGKQRDRRMLGHMNKALDRSGDQVLHRIKGAANAGRIGREPPKGPAAPRGPRATMQRLGNANPQQQMQQMQQMNPNNPLGQMTQQQQMQLFAMYEQQAKMMQQIFCGNAPNPQQPKSLFDRVDARSTQRGGFRGGKQPNFRHDHTSQNTSANGEPLDPDSSMEVEPGSQSNSKLDATTTMCRFNLTCSKPDCPFVHQSPAAPPGTAIDMTDTCSYGASCKNRKCTARHPSPARLGPLGPSLHGNPGTGNLSTAAPLGSMPSSTAPDCKYYPHCSNPTCPFKHPTMPPCRNGADCSTAGCRFFHNSVPCKFDPCLNPACPYKHAEGQKRGNYRDKVWVSPSGEAQNHVSERRFVDGEGEEELVKPEVQGHGDAEVQAQVEGTNAEDSGVQAQAQAEGIIS